MGKRVENDIIRVSIMLKVKQREAFRAEADYAKDEVL